MGVTGERLEKLEKGKNWRRNVTIELLVGRQTNDKQGKLDYLADAGRLI